MPTNVPFDKMQLLYVEHIKKLVFESMRYIQLEVQIFTWNV